MLNSLALYLCLLSPIQPLAAQLPEVKLLQVQPEQKKPAPTTGPTLVLPAEIRVKHGLALIVPLENTCDDVSWNILDDGIEPLPPGLMAPPGTFCVQTFEPGTYRVQAVGVGVVDGKAKITPFQVTKVIVGPIGPGPGPKPPDPVPEPTDPLFPKLKTAWATDGKDAAALSKLVQVYKTAAPILLNPAQRPDIKTAGDLISAGHKVIEGLIPGKMMTVRRVLADDLTAIVLVAPDAPLTDTLRSTFSTQFARAASLLEALPR